MLFRSVHLPDFCFGDYRVFNVYGGEVLAEESPEADILFGECGRNGKIPVGPICSPSESSIKAVLNPTNTDCYYFVADKTGKAYFSKTYAEHQKIVKALKEQGLWYTYE